MPPWMRAPTTIEIERLGYLQAEGEILTHEALQLFESTAARRPRSSVAACGRALS
jgi:hypothetical protein